MIVNGVGLHVDLSGAGGDLWDPATVARIVWGHKNLDGQLFGRGALKNGDVRPLSTRHRRDPAIGERRVVGPVASCPG